MDWNRWEDLKQKGSAHYRGAGEIQPIDLYYSLDPRACRAWMILEICNHALRNLVPRERIAEDMDKIIHYAELLKAIHAGEGV